MKHGHGTEKFTNGDLYVGYYENGKPGGFGEFHWHDGSSYKGFFKNGLRHGKGVWRKNPGTSDVYDGEWLNGKKCNEGVYTWANGDVYKGNYFDDLRDGYGEMYWANGTCYKGNWRRDVQEGVGTLFVPGKEPLQGIFKENVYVGPAEEEEEKRTILPRIHMIDTPSRQMDHPINILDSTDRNRRSYSAPKSSTLPKIAQQQKDGDFSPLPTDLSHSQCVEYASIEDQPTIQNYKNKPPRLADDSEDLKRKLLEKILKEIEEKPRNDFRLKIRDQATQVSMSQATSPLKPRRLHYESPDRGTSVKRAQYNLGIPSPRYVKPLTTAELLRWTARVEKIPIFERKKYENLDDPEVVKKIREIMYPRIWKQWRRFSILPGRSDVDPPAMGENIRIFFKHIP